MRRFLIVLSSVLALSACNTMIQRPTQVMHVDTPGVKEASCDLSTSKARYQILTPGETRVGRSPHDMTIVCRKLGYEDKTVVLKPEVEAKNTLWNAFNGMIPGVAYDIETQSIWNYPSKVDVHMTALPAGERGEGGIMGAPVLLMRAQDSNDAYVDPDWK